MTDAVMVIGANGGIGHALVQKILDQFPDKTVFAVARDAPRSPITASNLRYVRVDTSDETAIDAQVNMWKAQGVRVSLAICTIGVLQDHTAGLFPEKKLEELSSASLARYFHINTIMPSLWLKGLVNLAMPGCKVVVISARVGSIADNKLGGWYGYRASKAALNMVIKSAAVEFARRIKGSQIISYHPGTVDTALSKPFQSAANKNKLLQPEQTATFLLSLLQSLPPEESPVFIDWQGQRIEW